MQEYDADDADGDGLRDTAGTPAFMAPESVQVSSATFAGRPVDLWAMGVCCTSLCLAVPLVIALLLLVALAIRIQTT